MNNNEIIVESKFKRKPIKYEVNENGCWNCTSHISRGGDSYPKLKLNRKTVIMSRYIYERYVGEIQSGLMIRHKCDNRRCINPDHLETGTAIDNVHDRMKRGTSKITFNTSANKRYKNFKGEECGNSKLNQKQVDEIRKDNRQYKFISVQYNISKANISDIKNNKIWSI